MGMFDSLIEKGQEPKAGMEYIYAIDTAWPYYDGERGSLFGDERPYSIKVKKYIIVTDVESKKREDGYHLGYDFTIKDSGIRCHCNYPWAFWENTPENLVKINEYKVEQKKLDEQEKLVKRLRNNIDQLSL